MALDIQGLFKIAGKYIKSLNTTHGYIAAFAAMEDEIFTALESEGLEKYYASLPAQIDNMQFSIVSWLQQFIVNVTDLLADTDYVVDELAISSYSTQDILNGLIDYMTDNSDSIKPSVVTLGGADVDKADTRTGLETVPYYPTLFCSRTLDGVASPGNDVIANTRYLGLESQLAQSCTVYAELISNATGGSEMAQLHCGLPRVLPYQVDTELPGTGSVISSVESQNLVANNYDFSEWTDDTPDNWTMAGGVEPTDWGDSSGTGAGPLELRTAGVTATQQITGLVHDTLYFIGCSILSQYADTGGTITAKLRLKNAAGTNLITTITLSGIAVSEYHILYGFFYLENTVDLDDVYLEIEFDAMTGSENVMVAKQAVVSPVVFYNGLAWAYWVPEHTEGSYTYGELGHKASLAVVNNNAGVLQTFFRKALNVQLPTAASPTIADTLAT